MTNPQNGDKSSEFDNLIWTSQIPIRSERYIAVCCWILTSWGCWGMLLGVDFYLNELQPATQPAWECRQMQAGRLTPTTNMILSFEQCQFWRNPCNGKPSFQTVSYDIVDCTAWTETHLEKHGETIVWLATFLNTQSHECVQLDILGPTCWVSWASKPANGARVRLVGSSVSANP